MWKIRVFDKMRELGITFHTLLGNHDIFFKNTHAVSSSMLLLQESYDNIIVYSEPTTIEIAGTEIAIIPWLTKENEETTTAFMQTGTSAKIAFGHFELSGFEMDRGNRMSHGISSSKLSKFHTVYSGHYHHKNDNGHVFYLGTPYQITWIDHGSQKGFHVWDSVSLDIEHIPNDDNIFIELVYDDSVYQWDNFDFASLKDKFVKLSVINKTELYKYDIVMSRIYGACPADVKIIETVFEIDSENDEKIDVEATSVTLEKYIDGFDTHLDKPMLKSIMRLLYTEALHIEDV
jgi:hypothetical protein